MNNEYVTLCFISECLEAEADLSSLLTLMSLESIHSERILVAACWRDATYSVGKLKLRFLSRSMSSSD